MCECNRTHDSHRVEIQRCDCEPQLEAGKGGRCSAAGVWRWSRRVLHVRLIRSHADLAHLWQQYRLYRQVARNPRTGRTIFGLSTMLSVASH